MKNRVVTFLAILLVFIAGCRQKEEKKVVYEKKPIQVKIITAQKGVLTQELNFKGTVSPWKSANIGPDISGRIYRIYHKQGDKVAKGTLLAELDTVTLKLQQKQMQAAVAVARASYNDALLNFQRLEKLLEKNAVSQMQVEKAKLGLEAADTQKQSAEANLDVLDHTLNNSYMRAPFNGIITSKNMEEGDMINPMMGMSASVLTLMDLNKIKVIIDIVGEEIEKVKIDQPCRLVIQSLPEKTFAGKVYSRNLAADPLSKTFKVEVAVDNPGLEIKAGVFAEAWIEVFKKENVLLLPHSAVIGNDYVVLFENGQAKRVKVQLGERNDRQVEIVSGVLPGQQVVIEGNYDLKDGALITPSEER